MTRAHGVLLLLVVCLTLAGCQTPNKLQDENDKLRAEVAELLERIADLEDGMPAEAAPLSKIRSFTVGLAAASADFNDDAFQDLLMHSLKAAGQTKSFRVSREGNEVEAAKIRGMLVQQYLAAEEIPITISNLTYKVQSADREFKIGNRVVPKSEVELSRVASGKTSIARVAGPVPAIMSRDAKGAYSVAYEELGGGGGGNIPIAVRDVEIMDAESGNQSARQGDISFNWNVNLAKVAVYRIENFQGDVGRFARSMRYPGIRSSIHRYQTLRDFVFLFGYGNYSTGLVNQIRTPAHIARVEVLAVDAKAFKALEGGIPEDEILSILGKVGKWQDCEFVDIQNGMKVWERPASVGFPFVSRQVSEERSLSFYTKYDDSGDGILIGDFELENK